MKQIPLSAGFTKMNIKNQNAIDAMRAGGKILSDVLILFLNH